MFCVQEDPLCLAWAGASRAHARPSAAGAGFAALGWLPSLNVVDNKEAAPVWDGFVGQMAIRRFRSPGLLTSRQRRCKVRTPSA